MSSSQPAIALPEALSTDLCSDLFIMLHEAGQRDSPCAALSVISGILEELKNDYPEISPLASEWRRLAQAMRNERSVVPVLRGD